MTISIVPLTAADRQRLLAVDNAAFFFDPNAHPVDIVTNHFDWSRTFGASRAGSDELELDRGAVFTAPSLEDAASRVTTRFVQADSDDAARVVHDLHLLCAEDALGSVTRPERMARPLFVDLPLTRQGREPWQVLIAHVDGQPAGYAVFSRQSKWTDFRAKGTVAVCEMAAIDPMTYLTLARRLVDFDLTASITINGRAADDPLMWWAGGPRGLGVKTFDSLWLRLIDVGAALTERGYSSPCDIVLDVVDPTCPWNQRAWRLTVDDAGVGTCQPTSDEADVRLPVQALGAAYLGSRSIATQADQGLVTELTPGSVWLLSRAMSCDREPAGAIEF